MLSIIFLSLVGTMYAAVKVESDTSPSIASCGFSDCSLNCLVFDKDEDGCPICQCTWCEDLNCDLECEEGYKTMTDSDGFLCPVCACDEWSMPTNDNNTTNWYDDFDYSDIQESQDDYTNAIFVYLKDKAMLHRLLHIDHKLFKELVEELEKDLQEHMEESGALKAVMLARNNGTYAKAFQEAFNDGTLATNETTLDHFKAILLKEHYAIDNARKSKDHALEKLSKKAREVFENPHWSAIQKQEEGQVGRRVIADAEAEEGDEDNNNDEYTDAIFVYLKEKAILHRLLRMDHKQFKELVHNLEEDLEQHMEETGALKAFFLAMNNGTYIKEFQHAYNDGTLTTNETTYEHFKMFIFKEHYAIEEARKMKDKAIEEHSLAHGVIDSYVKNIEDARKTAREVKDRVIDEEQLQERVAKMKIMRNRQPEM